MVNNETLLPQLLKKVSYATLEDMYAAIGYGGLTAVKAVNRMKDELIRFHKKEAAETEAKETAAINKQPKQATSGIIVEDIDNCMIKFARCCTPVPGDDIVGFITKGFGVSVHRRDCPNAAGAASPENSGRWVKVAWADDGLSDHFSTTLEIDSVDRDGLVLDIATVLSGSKLKVTELSAKTQPNGRSLTIATFDVNNVAELNTVKQKLLNVQGVTAIRRGHN
jgi:GTP pyrophosphokinase